MLTKIEEQIADIVALGGSISDVSETLCISQEKANEYINSICKKINKRHAITLEQLVASYY